MKIVKATDYGFRTVFKLLMNPDDVHHVHSDDSTHPTENVNGCTLEGIYCQNMHKTREIIFDGEEQFYTRNGVRVRKDTEMFLAEIKERLADSSTPTIIESVLGRTI